MSEEQFAALDPRFTPALDLLHRTGLVEFQMRFQDDEKPIVWIALGRWRPEPAYGRPKGHWETASALHPVEALLRLCAQSIDGGQCVHCHRPTGFVEDLVESPTEIPALDATVCWYAWDPELSTFRRGCE